MSLASIFTAVLCRLCLEDDVNTYTSNSSNIMDMESSYSAKDSGYYISNQNADFKGENRGGYKLSEKQEAGSGDNIWSRQEPSEYKYSSSSGRDEEERSQEESLSYSSTKRQSTANVRHGKTGFMNSSQNGHFLGGSDSLNSNSSYSQGGSSTGNNNLSSSGYFKRK